MATLKQRLHRKNSSGTYDTIHYETSSDVVMRPSGRSVEQDLAAYLPEVQNNDNVPQSLKSSKLVVGLTKGFLRGKALSVEGHIHDDRYYTEAEINNLLSGKSPSNHTHDDRYYTESEVNSLLSGKANSSHNHSASQITSGMLPLSRGGTGVTSLAELKDQLGISPIANIISGVALGSLVCMDYMLWRVVHIDIAAGEFVMCLETIEVDETAFGSSAVYSGSTIVDLCNTFKNKLSPATKSKLITKYVHGVANTVWIPQINWISSNLPNSDISTGTSSWSGTNVFAYFRNDDFRIALNVDGEVRSWWTASAHSPQILWFVNTIGEIDRVNPTFPSGFRPFVALPL